MKMAECALCPIWSIIQLKFKVCISECVCGCVCVGVSKEIMRRKWRNIDIHVLCMILIFLFLENAFT